MKNIILFVLITFTLCSAQEIKNIPIEKGAAISSLELSNNGSLVVLQFQKDGKEYIQLNDKTYGPFDELFQQKFSKDGSSYGYAFQKVDKVVLQVNGKDVITINRPVEFENFAFSDNGEKIELIYSENGKLFLIGDFGEYGPFENANDLFVSPNGLKFGFAYSTSDTSYFVKVNDKISGPYLQISFLRNSEDYSSIGYKYATENGYMLVLNDKLFGPYKYVNGPIISANGSSHGYIYEKEDGLRYFQINDKPAEQLAIGHLSFSNDGSKYCFSYFKDDKFFVRYNDKTFGPFEGLTDLRMSADGSSWGIRYDIGYNIFIQINENIKLGPFSEVKNPVFSPSGSSFAFHFSKNEKWYAQINNESFGPFDDVNQITFSSDGSKYCFTYTNGENQFLQVNKKVVGPYQFLKYAITNNNEIYIAYKKIGENFIVLEKFQ